MPNGLRYPLVGGTRQRRFDGTGFEPSVNPFWRRIPTSRVHALLAGAFGLPYHRLLHIVFYKTVSFDNMKDFTNSSIVE